MLTRKKNASYQETWSCVANLSSLSDYHVLDWLETHEDTAPASGLRTLMRRAEAALIVAKGRALSMYKRLESLQLSTKLPLELLFARWEEQPTNLSGFASGNLLTVAPWGLPYKFALQGGANI